MSERNRPAEGPGGSEMTTAAVDPSIARRADAFPDEINGVPLAVLRELARRADAPPVT